MKIPVLLRCGAVLVSASLSRSFSQREAGLNLNCEQNLKRGLAATRAFGFGSKIVKFSASACESFGYLIFALPKQSPFSLHCIFSICGSSLSPQI